MKIPISKEEADKAKLYIDGCDFRTVKAYYLDSSSEISFICLVQDGYELHDIAAFFMLEKSDEAQRYWDWAMENNVFKFVVQDLRDVMPSGLSNFVLLDTIPDDQACEVIYQPPFYIVKLI